MSWGNRSRKGRRVEMPSRRTEVLTAAIGRRLLEIERLFLLDLSAFLEDTRFSRSDFFSYNSGPVQLHFEGGLTHVLSVWPSQLSLIVMKDELHETKYDRLYRLSDFDEQRRIGHWEIWADPLSAWEAVGAGEDRGPMDIHT